MTAVMSDRLAARALAAVIVIGSAVLWIGVPMGSFWLAAQLTSDSVRGVLFALLAIPLAMALGAWGLYRVNALYERLRGERPRRTAPPAWRQSLGERRGGSQTDGPPRLIDVTMTGSAIAALVLLLVWFFFFAHMSLAPLG